MTDHPTGPARPRYTRQHRHSARLGWTLALIFASASGLPAAQAANCAGIRLWLGTTIYQPGATLQKDGVLYQARQTIWNAPPDHPAGRHYYDNLGRCDDTAPAANQPPQVHLTSPSAGSTFSAGSTITFKAAATDSDGSIRKVEFFRNGHSMGSVGNAPYSLAWHNAAAGNYLLSAVATD
ncbi:MAG: Ig-like domain-containing protein, partial [Stenotrophomonas sp.]